MLVLRPMNCLHHMEIYNNDVHSYKEFPIRIAELGMMHRYENVYRCAVYFASTEDPDPEKLKWWNWKDAPLPSGPAGKELGA